MTLQSDVRYLLDRLAIQDVIARYGLGQDLHQGDNEDQNMLAQWAEGEPGWAARASPSREIAEPEPHRPAPFIHAMSFR
jgi:hypothetical protein